MGFGGGDVVVLKMPLETAREAWQRHYFNRTLWPVEGDYRSSHPAPANSAGRNPAHEPTVYERLVINPDQVKVLQRLL